jgi:hypothetical protein
VQAIDANINKTWMPQDIWLIVAWHFLITKGRKKAFNLARKYLYKEKDKDKKVWEKSFWRWVANPMRVVGALWWGCTNLEVMKITDSAKNKKTNWRQLTLRKLLVSTLETIK